MIYEDPDYRSVCGNCRQWKPDNQSDEVDWGECTAEIPIWLDSLLVVEECLGREYIDKRRKCRYTDTQAEYCDRFSPHPPPPSANINQEAGK